MCLESKPAMSTDVATKRNNDPLQINRTQVLHCKITVDSFCIIPVYFLSSSILAPHLCKTNINYKYVFTRKRRGYKDIISVALTRPCLQATDDPATQPGSSPVPPAHGWVTAQPPSPNTCWCHWHQTGRSWPLQTRHFTGLFKLALHQKLQLWPTRF